MKGMQQWNAESKPDDSEHAKVWCGQCMQYHKKIEE